MTLFPQTQKTIQAATEAAKDSVNVALAISVGALVIAAIALIVAVSRN